MSVRVNLLPGEVEERNRAARSRALMGVAGLVLVALLAVLYVLQLGRVSSAEDELAAEQQRLSELQAEQAELQEFADLETQAAASTTLLATALADEVTIAGILQDIAAVMPTDAALTTLSMTATPGAGELPPGVARPSVGRITATGESLRGHAPGLERFLIEFDKVASFIDVFFSTSTVDETGVSTFSFEVDLGTEIRTNRYDAGLPQELR